MGLTHSPAEAIVQGVTPGDKDLGDILECCQLL